MRTRWVILIALIALLVGAVVGGAVGFFAGAASGLAGRVGVEPENVLTVVEAPDSVAQGNSFTVTVTVTNNSPSPITVGDIDIADTYLEGASVTSVQPLRVPNAGFGTHTYGFGITIPAGGTSVFTFSLTADKPGTYFGDWDVWINGLSLASRGRALTITTPQ